MKRVGLALALLAFAVTLPARAATSAPVEIAHGHLQLGGPWTRFSYSMAVLNDHDDIDGFFFDVTPYRGKKIQAVLVRTSPCATDVCAPADLDLNFHDTTTPGQPYWHYEGGCSTGAREEICKVPPSATRGEVSGYQGYEVDVRVMLLDPPA